MSFRDYIHSRRETHTSQGDFVRDAKEDRRLPDAQSWDELHRHVLRHGGDSDVVDAARKVWQAYLAKQRRQLAGA